MQEFPNLFGINSLNVSILLNIPKYGGIRNVMTNWTDIDLLRQLRTGRSLKELLRRPSTVRCGLHWG